MFQASEGILREIDDPVSFTGIKLFSLNAQHTFDHPLSCRIQFWPHPFLIYLVAKGSCEVLDISSLLQEDFMGSWRKRLILSTRVGSSGPSREKMREMHDLRGLIQDQCIHYCLHIKPFHFYYSNSVDIGQIILLESSAIIHLITVLFFQNEAGFELLVTV